MNSWNEDQLKLIIWLYSYYTTYKYELICKKVVFIIVNKNGQVFEDVINSAKDWSTTHRILYADEE